MNSLKTLGKTAIAALSGVGTYIVAAGNAIAADYDYWLGFVDLGPQNEDLPSFIQNVLSFVIGAVALVAVIMLIWNGVQYITAGGDEGKVEKATKGITNAVIGLVICFVAELIVQFVISIVVGAGS